MSTREAIGYLIGVPFIVLVVALVIVPGIVHVLRRGRRR